MLFYGALLVILIILLNSLQQERRIGELEMFVNSCLGVICRYPRALLEMDMEGSDCKGGEKRDWR